MTDGDVAAAEDMKEADLKESNEIGRAFSE